jgi:hypothetical protein
MYIDVDPHDWNMEKVTSITVDIHENDTPAKFQLSQNAESVIIYFDNTKHRIINVTDISGKTISNVNTEVNKYTINTSSLPNGVYMIVSSDGTNRYVDKFVK